MYEKEINNYDWIVSPNLKIWKIDVKCIESNEAESILNIMKRGRDNKNPEILVDCSYQDYITKFQKSQLFTLEVITVSTIRTDKNLGGFVLAIQGSMILKGITIKKKKYFVSEEHKEMLSEKIVKIRKKGLNKSKN